MKLTVIASFLTLLTSEFSVGLALTVNSSDVFIENTINPESKILSQANASDGGRKVPPPY
jgi:hypothetical protein